ncbi:MAG: alternative ribosome rescue aminoacyl-tRNA hydrolase ArfB [Pseudolabrys sp.]|jgi:ribosome-associated protein|nr:alternative ribosome rescue aminoacyl-tRNA hydrolase ArfB [Pseudolabrys sp.]
MIPITDTISIQESELSESFVRASGPGGQNVNKVSSAVQLRFDARHSPSLPNDVAVRLMRIAGKRLTKEGVIVIVAQQHRTQERNREDARERLFDMIRQAAVRPTPRRPTKVPKAQRRERLETKKHRSGIKTLRRSKPGWD